MSAPRRVPTRELRPKKLAADKQTKEVIKSINLYRKQLKVIKKMDLGKWRKIADRPRHFELMKQTLEKTRVDVRGRDTNLERVLNGHRKFTSKTEVGSQEPSNLVTTSDPQ